MGHQQRDHHSVDEWPGDQVLWPVGHQPAEEVGLELAMSLPDGTLELNPLALDLEKHPTFLIVNSSAQFRLELGHLIQDVVDSIVHGSSIGLCTQSSVAATLASP